MAKDEDIKLEDEELEEENENEATPESGSGHTVVPGNKEGAQSAEAMFGEEAARSGIIPGLTDRDVTAEVKTAFLDYSMSVIVSRAIPDVRDGFKPVQRRIMYGMNESGMQPGKPYKKCARIVGDVMGKYHPHGDSALYGTLVRLAQPFSLRYPLVDGHGNFGSIDGDEAAAMRYTEARMEKLALELVRDINCDTVNFVANYDGTEVEPEVLPCRFPNLLVNGSQGIAVGMATNMPPHNMTEAIDAVVATARNPKITPEEIIQNYMFGPDFPTGGTILGRQGILDYYRTGFGTVTIRSKYHIEEMDNGKSRIIVTEIPYQVNKENMVKNMAELVRDKVIDGITDLRDESNKEGIRIVIEIRKDMIPEVVCNNLLKHTSLQTNFGVINLCLEDGAPAVLGIVPLLNDYVEFQIRVLTRRTKFLLKRDEDRLHLVEGLILAHDNIDEVIHIIRESADDEESTQRLNEAFGLSKEQCAAILAMTLRRLQGMEQEKLQAEKTGLEANIVEYKRLLSSRENIVELLVEELEEVKRKFGDKRMTEISDDLADIDNEDLIPQKHILITLTRNNYIKRMDDDTFEAQHRGGKGIIGMKTTAGDLVKLLVHTFTHTDVLFFTTLGKVYRLRGYQIPDSGRTGKGTPAQNLLNLDKDEKVVSIVPCDDYDENSYLFFVSRFGIVKRTSLKEYASIHSNGKIALGLKEGDDLFDVKRTNGKEIITLASSNGKACSFFEEEVRPMGRTAAGVRGMDLGDGSEIVGVTGTMDGTKILALTTKGFGKISYAKDTVDEAGRSYDGYRLSHRGAKGVYTIKLTNKTGKLVAVRGVSGDEDLMVITNTGTVIRTPLSEVRIAARNTQGVTIIKIDEKSKVAACAIVPHQDPKEIEEEEALDETLVEEVPATPDTLDDDLHNDEE